MNIKNTKKIMTITILFVLVVAGVYLFALHRVKTEINNTIILLEETENEREKNAIFDSTKNKISEVKKYIERLDTLFINHSSVVDFIQQLEELGNYSGADIVIESLDEKNAKGLAFSLEVTGTFSEVKHTIALLENMPYNILFTQTQITHSLCTESKNKWKGNISAILLSFTE